jgi:alkanesulfonate monooxygenase SsuD/methylene tetrahydromethanopterin reductase-like flavin-dependent oxidoreductase (luciferase family)
VADGAISWLCAPDYLRNVAIPAMAEGAALAERQRPPLVAHLLVMLTEDAEEARQAVRQAVGIFPRIKAYQDMFADAGFPEARETGQWSDAMADAVCVYGSEATVRAALTALAAYGFDELMVAVLGTARAETLALLGSVSEDESV